MAPPSQDLAAQVAALQQQVAGNAAWQREMADELKAIRILLAQAQGGMSVLRWIAGGSLVAFIGMLVTIWQWASRGAGH